MSEILEVVMLACFGASWPFSVARSYRARTAKGKSLIFLLLIFIGYLIGLAGKLIYNPSWAISVYALNTLMVGIDLALFFRNRALDQKRSSAS